MGWGVRRAVWLLTLTTASALTACGPGYDSARDFLVGDPIQQSAPLSPGEVVWIDGGATRLVGAESAELLDLEALGMPSNLSVEPMLIPMRDKLPEIGDYEERLVPRENLEALAPLRGAIVRRDDGYFQVLVRLTMPDRDLTIHGFRLSYQVGGQRHALFLPTSAHACPTRAGECKPVDVHE